MIIDCVSDLHGHFPKLDGGDLLIIAGDLTKSDSEYDWADFIEWLCAQKYRKKIFIAGNHDNFLYSCNVMIDSDQDIIYLQDSGTEFEGLKIWGSPWTKTFDGMNPRCKAFTVDTDEELAKKWSLIPDDTDILITHTPPFSWFDTVRGSFCHDESDHVGSLSLFVKYMELKKLKLFIFGHVHESYGVWDMRDLDEEKTVIVNASHVNERYKPVNEPVRVIL